MKIKLMICSLLAVSGLLGSEYLINEENYVVGLRKSLTKFINQQPHFCGREWHVSYEKSVLVHEGPRGDLWTMTDLAISELGDHNVFNRVSVCKVFGGKLWITRNNRLQACEEFWKPDPMITATNQVTKAELENHVNFYKSTVEGSDFVVFLINKKYPFFDSIRQSSEVPLFVIKNSSVEYEELRGITTDEIKVPKTLEKTYGVTSAWNSLSKIKIIVGLSLASVTAIIAFLFYISQQK